MIDMLREKIKMYGKEDRVTTEEIVEYLNADKYQNDIYTIHSILSNEYLILHEILEVCCIKSKGIEIDEKTIVDNREVVYFCHLEAKDGEMEHA